MKIGATDVFWISIGALVGGCLGVIVSFGFSSGLAGCISLAAVCALNGAGALAISRIALRTWRTKAETSVISNSHAIGRCPHCAARVNPLRLLLSWRSSPYRCGRCGRLCEIPQQDRRLLAGLPGGLAVLPGAFIFWISGKSLVALAGFALSVGILIASLLALFARFQPASHTKPSG